MNSSPLISASDLATQLGDANLLVVDCRFELADPARGAREYAAVHVPGALFADLDRDLSDLSKTGLGRHPLPDAAAFSAVLSRWGWTPQMQVVAYDDAGGALAAARLWWMLRLAGATNVVVLDGGWGAWQRAGLPVEAGTPSRVATAVAIEFAKNGIVYTDELRALRERGMAVILDARGAPRFRGEVEPIDPVAGHVPGALNRPFAENLQGDGRFKDPEILRREFEALLHGRGADDAVHMCGSGVTACHNLLA
ncbi:sulfurtransferase, partial [Rudaea sp.]|uniref:sulfurtransferase n=1 Tax=Rudaea sp. TaxID=2136325 RepID=UPI002ED5B99D